MVGSDGRRKFFKIGPPRLAKTSKIFQSKAFIKQDFVEIKERICNVIMIFSKITNTKTKAKKINQRLWRMVIISRSL